MRRHTLVAMALLAPTALLAQIPETSPRALGMGSAYSLLAEGFEAASWNPAVLATSHRPGFSIGLPAASMEFGSNSWGLSELRRYADKALTDADKQALLDMVDTALVVRGHAGVAPFGLSIGPFAISAATAASTEAGLGRDAVELVLFGNASRTGPGQYFTAAGSGARGWSATTVAASFALPFALPLGRLSVGVTGKKVFGHGMGLARETASQLRANPAFSANAAGHAIYTSYPDDYSFETPGDVFGSTASPGSGFGLDVGGVLELAGRQLTIGAVLVNVVGGMSWDESRLRYERSMQNVVQNPDGSVADFDSVLTLEGAAIDADPVARELKDSLLARSDFSRLARIGATMRLGGLTLAGDAQVRLSRGLDDRPQQLVRAGAEYVLLGFLPLRAGIGTDFAETLTLSGGTGLHLGPVRLDVGVANLSGSDRPGVRLAAGLGLIF
jgi:hypothetical protein